MYTKEEGEEEGSTFLQSHQNCVSSASSSFLSSVPSAAATETETAEAGLEGAVELGTESLVDVDGLTKLGRTDDELDKSGSSVDDRGGDTLSAACRCCRSWWWDARGDDASVSGGVVASLRSRGVQ
jgi:hypothetical protein